MCKTGNQSIYRECREAILRQTGHTTMSNQEMRRIIEREGGCMMPFAYQSSGIKYPKTK